jgi:O-antigen ligase
MDTFLRIPQVGYRTQMIYGYIALIAGVFTVALVTGTGFADESDASLVVLVAFIGLGIVGLIAPIEWLLLLSAGAVILADSYLFPAEKDSLRLYFTRFIPMGILAIRSLLIFLTHRLDTKILPGIFLKPFGLLFFLAILSTLYDRLNPSNTLMRSLSMGFILCGFGIGVPFYLANERRLERGLHSLLVFLALVVCAGLIPFPFLSHTMSEFDDYVRVRGIFKNANTLGVMAMLTFFPLFAWWKESTKGHRFLLGLLTMMVLVTLLVSGSRASMVGFLSGTLLFIGFSRINIRSKILIFSIGVAISLVLLLPRVFPGLMRVDTGLRPELWGRAFELGMRSPVLGVGFGSTNEIFIPDQEYLLKLGVTSAGSHNEYLRLFVGLGGMGVFLAFWGFARILLKVIHLLRHQTHRLLLLSLFAAVISGLIHALFEDWIFAFGGAPAIPFWFFLAVMSLYVRQDELARLGERVQKNSSRRSNLPAFRPLNPIEKQ